MASIIPASKLRFAVLGVEGDSSSGSDGDYDGGGSHGVRKDAAGRGGGGGGGGVRGGGVAGRSDAAAGTAGGTATGDKKRARKKKKKEKMIEQTNELRNLAFKKLPVRPPVRGEGDTAPPHAQPDPHRPNGEQRSNGERSGAADGTADEGTSGQLETLESFDADLQRALRLSKMEYEFQKTGSVDPEGIPRVPNRKERRKLLQEARERDVVPRPSPAATEAAPPEPPTAHGAHTDGHADAPHGSSSSSKAADKSRGGGRGNCGSAAAAGAAPCGADNGPAERAAARQPSPVLETVRIEQLKDDLEKKEKEVGDLKRVTAEWEVKFKEVKKRNAQLLYMLQQGEMKEKSDVLLQVEELTNIKNELTQQVSDLHTALEQERSKVKTLQAELVKHQQGGKKVRKASESEH